MSFLAHSLYCWKIFHVFTVMNGGKNQSNVHVNFMHFILTSRGFKMFNEGTESSKLTGKEILPY